MRSVDRVRKVKEGVLWISKIVNALVKGSKLGRFKIEIRDPIDGVPGDDLK